VSQLIAALEQLGVHTDDVHLAPHQPTGATLALAADADGIIWIKALGRDEADAQVFAKLRQFVLYKDSGPALYLNRLQQIEHEAYAMLLAHEAGVHVPEVVVAGRAGPGTALLVARGIPGRLLADLDGADITDGLLDALWDQVAALHGARIAHGALNASRVVVSDTGPAIVDFFASSSSGAPERIAADVAELLVSTAAIVGEERAIGAAMRGVGAEAIAAALPILQPTALTRDTRRASGGSGADLNASLQRLRELGAAAAGSEAPRLEELHRVSRANLLMAVGTLIAVGALLSQVGNPQELWDTVKNAEWAWVAVAFGLSMATNPTFAVALMGTVPERLPLWPTTECQVAMSFSNLAVPYVGGTAVQIRYLQKQGLDLRSAIASGGLLSGIANIVTQIGLFIVALVLTDEDFHLDEIPTDSIAAVILFVVAIVALAVGVIVGVPRFRHRVLPIVKPAADTIWAALHSPHRVFQLLAGNAAASLLYGLCLLACLAAYGSTIPFWTLLAVNIGVSTIAGLIPVPGGGTAIASVGLSAALTAVGVPEAVAVAAILTNQIVVSYLPAVPGWLATRDMMRRDYL
jgi:uncharacterized membrane protein YbhN (UPF0104 family)/tRNA A-37 threonylcarbamoyl transferase component Bud32